MITSHLMYDNISLDNISLELYIIKQLFYDKNILNMPHYKTISSRIKKFRNYLPH